MAQAMLLVSLGACAEQPPTRVSLPPGYGDGLKGRVFDTGGTHHVLADLHAVALQLTFDVPEQTTRGHAEIQFRPTETGVPFFLLTPTATSATLDGRPVRLTAVSDPDRVTTFTSMGVELAADTDHFLVIDYTLSTPRYSATGVDFETSMLDTVFPSEPEAPPTNYFEAYGPSSIEADQFQLSVELELVGATASHRVFANGQQQATLDRWTLEFPDYFSASSFYFHLSERPLTVRELTYHGLDDDIPITVYWSSEAPPPDAAFAVEALPGLFTDLESTYGPYPHAAFLVHIADGVTGGMEYAGATVTNVRALSHELGHSWFARGVLPADGRSGWIDEAIVTWQDQQRRRDTLSLIGSPGNLANYSMWLQPAPGYFHFDGATLLAGLDGLLADTGGLLPVLRSLYGDFRKKPITTEQFLAYIEAHTGRSFAEYFQQYVYDGTPPLVAR